MPRSVARIRGSRAFSAPLCFVLIVCSLSASRSWAVMLIGGGIDGPGSAPPPSMTTPAIDSSCSADTTVGFKTTFGRCRSMARRTGPSSQHRDLLRRRAGSTSRSTMLRTNAWSCSGVTTARVFSTTPGRCRWDTHPRGRRFRPRVHCRPHAISRTGPTIHFASGSSSSAAGTGPT